VAPALNVILTAAAVRSTPNWRSHISAYRESDS
jgi:hypothetical protein